jgi:hypothetical protein
VAGIVAVSPERLEDKIRAAFAGVELGGGISLRQAQVIDRYGEGVSDREYEALPKGEITNDWSKVPFDELERDCVAHLDAEGLRYYLPALMLGLLSHYDAGSMRVIGTISALDSRDGYNQRRYALLTEPQRRAIASFLSALPNVVDLWDAHAKVASRSLQAYWCQYSGESELPPNTSLERTRAE